MEVNNKEVIVEFVETKTFKTKIRFDEDVDLENLPEGFESNLLEELKTKGGSVHINSSLGENCVWKPNTSLLKYSKGESMRIVDDESLSDYPDDRKFFVNNNGKLTVTEGEIKCVLTCFYDTWMNYFPSSIGPSNEDFYFTKEKGIIQEMFENKEIKSLVDSTLPEISEYKMRKISKKYQNRITEEEKYKNCFIDLLLLRDFDDFVRNTSNEESIFGICSNS